MKVYTQHDFEPERVPCFTAVGASAIHVHGFEPVGGNLDHYAGFKLFLNPEHIPAWIAGLELAQKQLAENRRLMEESKARRCAEVAS